MTNFLPGYIFVYLLPMVLNRQMCDLGASRWVQYRYLVGPTTRYRTVLCTRSCAHWTFGRDAGTLINLFLPFAPFTSRNKRFNAFKPPTNKYNTGGSTRVTHLRASPLHILLLVDFFPPAPEKKNPEKNLCSGTISNNVPTVFLL